MFSNSMQCSISSSCTPVEYYPATSYISEKLDPPHYTHYVIWKQMGLITASKCPQTYNKQSAVEVNSWHLQLSPNATTWRSFPPSMPFSILFIRGYIQSTAQNVTLHMFNDIKEEFLIEKNIFRNNVSLNIRFKSNISATNRLETFYKNNQ